VSWNDAEGYLQWLSRATGKSYRLPSEAEWEYAARAGTTTPYWWGNVASNKQANYGSSVKKTTEVGTYPASPWGLFDTSGNAWEWVEDCYHGSYDGAPADGTAWAEGCLWSGRVLRGGSWGDLPEHARSAIRFRLVPGNRSLVLGFRVSGSGSV
jgi:formylglycine-generating enzyme required for sulfatase activity